MNRSPATLQTTVAPDRSGHLFGGRYKAHLVDEDAYARELIKYVHLNPVRPKGKGKPVPPELKRELTRYPWSSHRAYAGIGKEPCLDRVHLWVGHEKEKQGGTSFRVPRGSAVA